MKGYMVRLPITGILQVEVKANSKKEAIEKALMVNFSAEVESLEACVELEELDVIKQVVQGNVFLGSLNNATTVEIF